MEPLSVLTRKFSSNSHTIFAASEQDCWYTAEHKWRCEEWLLGNPLCFHLEVTIAMAFWPYESRPWTHCSHLEWENACFTSTADCCLFFHAFCLVSKLHLLDLDYLFIRAKLVWARNMQFSWTVSLLLLSSVPCIWLLYFCPTWKDLQRTVVVKALQPRACSRKRLTLWHLPIFCVVQFYCVAEGASPLLTLNDMRECGELTAEQQQVQMRNFVDKLRELVSGNAACRSRILLVQYNGRPSFFFSITVQST